MMAKDDEEEDDGAPRCCYPPILMGRLAMWRRLYGPAGLGLLTTDQADRIVGKRWEEPPDARDDGRIVPHGGSAPGLGMG